MIDPRLQDLLGSDAPSTRHGDVTDQEPEQHPGPDAAPAEAAGSAQSDVDIQAVIRGLIDDAVATNPALTHIAAAATSGVRMDTGGRVVASPELRSMMRALVPGPGDAPIGSTRLIGTWLTADIDDAAPVTQTSPYFTISHWHWLAAKDYVRRIPSELGPTFPHLFSSEAQVIHDLKEWGALDADGTITDEAAAMFAAVTGYADLTLYGTVLLYGQRRAPKQIPTQLVEFGLQHAVRDVPRVSFAIGIGEREVVTALVNNTTIVFSRRLRRTSDTADAAATVLDLLDPDQQWPAYPLNNPIVLAGETVNELATSKATAGLIDTEPGEDATGEERVAHTEHRDKVRTGVRTILAAARTPDRAAEAIADIATCTTHALAQITLRTSSVDVSRGDAGALALAFLRDRGVVASYPTGSRRWRRITYVRGTEGGIEAAISAMRSTYTGS